MKYSMVTGLVFLLLFASGCPSEPTTPPEQSQADGGASPDKGLSAKCEGDAVCLNVSAKSLRSCEMLFENPGSMVSSVAVFNGSLIGRFQSRGNRLAASFVLRDNKDYGGSGPLLVLRGLKQFKQTKLVKASCFGKDGKPLKEGVSVSFSK